MSAEADVEACDEDMIKDSGGGGGGGGEEIEGDDDARRVKMG